MKYNGKTLTLILILILSLVLPAVGAEKIHDIWTGWQAGELSPYLDGQVNFDKYAQGAKKLENFFPRIQGPVSNRSGFQYINSTKVAANRVRLIPFEFSTDQAYILELGASYIRYYKDGGQLTTVDATTLMLLPMDGKDADASIGSVFDQSTTTPHTPLLVGNVQHDTEFKKFGTASLLYDGSGDHLTVADNADFNSTTSDSGIDMWVQPQAGNSEQYNLWHQDTVASANTFVKAYLTWYTGLLVNGNGADESLIIADQSINTKTLTRDGMTSLLLHGTGSDGSTSFIDSSPTGHTVTPSGDVQISTVQKKFNSSSIKFDGTGDYLTISDHADLDLSGKIFSLRGHFYLTNLDSDVCIFSMWKDANNYIYMNVSTSGVIQLNIMEASSLVTYNFGSSITAGKWYNYTFTDDGTNRSGYLDGVQGIDHVTYTVDTIDYSTSDLLIGARHNAGDGGSIDDFFNGWIDDFQLIKGAATNGGLDSDFTAPTTSYSAIEVDTSDPKYGTGAMQFGGYDYLKVTGSADTDFGAGATGSADIFTLSMFFQPEAVTGTQYLFDMYVDATEWLRIYLDGTTLTAEHRQGSTTVTSSLGTVDTDWQHLAFVGDGTNVNVFLDGAEGGSVAITGALADLSAVDIFIGTDKDGANGFTGLIDDLKLMKNERYDVSTATLTVPTAEDRFVMHPGYQIGNNGSGTSTVLGADDSITTDQFHHVEFNYDYDAGGSQVYLFVDGQLDSDAAQSVSEDQVDYDEKVYIGTEVGGASNDFKGSMDELRFVKALVAFNTADFEPNTVPYLSLGTTVLETATTYTQAELPELQYTQSADTLYIVHPNHVPATLTRSSDVNWTLSDMSFTTNKHSPGATTYSTGGLSNWVAGAAPFVDGDVSTKQYDNNGDVTTDKFNIDMGAGNDRDFVEARLYTSQHIDATYKIMFSDDNTFSDLADNTAVASWSIGGGTGWKQVNWVSEGAHRYWKFELIANANAIGGDVTEIEMFTDLSPTSWGSGTYPSSVVFFEQRLWFSYLQTLWASKSGDYNNLTQGTADDDAMEYTIASNNVNKIEWLSSGQILVAGTSGSEYKISASNQNEALTPSNVRVIRQSSYGSAPQMPHTIKDVTLYLQRAGVKVREFTYQFETDTYVSPDLTLLAEHITASGIKDMAYQQEPFSILWCVRDDGNLAAMTYSRENGVVAWSEHTTDGDFENVAVIPSITGNAYDELWVVVKRNINDADVRYIERLSPQFGHDDSLEDAFIVDSGVTYDVPGVPKSTFTAAHLANEAVAVLADGVVIEGKTTDGSGNITLTDAAEKVHVGLPYTSTLQTMRWEGKSALGTAQGREKRINRIVFRLENAKQFKYGHNPTPTTKLKEKVFTSLSSGDYRVDPSKDNETQGHVTVINDQPVPITIIAIIPEVNLQ